MCILQLSLSCLAAPCFLNIDYVNGCTCGYDRAQQITAADSHVMLHLQVNEGQYLGMVSIRDVVSSCTFPAPCSCVDPAHKPVLMH